VVAVDNLTLDIHKGEIFGFLGPNGAGKTTTIRMLAGLIKPTCGDVYIDGWNVYKNPQEAKHLCGFIPDRPFIYGKLTGREFLRFIGKLYSVDPADTEKRIEQLFELFNIKDYGDELVESYSSRSFLNGTPIKDVFDHLEPIFRFTPNELPNELKIIDLYAGIEEYQSNEKRRISTCLYSSTVRPRSRGW